MQTNKKYAKLDLKLKGVIHIATSVYDRLKERGLSLPQLPPVPKTLDLARYLSDDTLYVSGTGPNNPGLEEIHGKVPTTVSEEEAYIAAQRVALSALAVIESEIGDLNRIVSFVKLLAFVACDDPSFSRQHIVANGASQLLIDLFGEEIGKSARSAVGVYSLPGDIPIEIEMIVKFK